jgi:pilus assembly protein Flp/PilA
VIGMSVRTRSKKTKLRLNMAIMRQRLAADERGATAIEYAMIAAGIGVAIAATVTSLGSAVTNLYTSIASIFG